MKDSLFEMLMNFFEKSLTRLTEKEPKTGDIPDQDILECNDAENIERHALTLRTPGEKSIRVFTSDELMKFTKPGYQFLMRVISWEIIGFETMELIINQLVFSESPIVTLEEIKWTIRNTLADNLDSGQLAFLDLVLSRKENRQLLH